MDGGGHRGDPGGNFVCNNLRQFIIWKVKHGLDIGGDGEPVLIDGADLATEGILEEGGGHAGGAFGAGMDEVKDGFGLGEVKLAEEEGAFGKFAGVGLAGSAMEGGLQDAPGGEVAAMAVDFDGILAGVGMGRPEEEHEGVIEHFVGIGIDDLSVGEGAGMAFGGGGGGTAEQGIGDAERVGPGEADDGDGAFTGRGGDGGDGIGWVGKGHVCGLIHPNGVQPQQRKTSREGEGIGIQGNPSTGGIPMHGLPGRRGYQTTGSSAMERAGLEGAMEPRGAGLEGGGAAMDGAWGGSGSGRTKSKRAPTGKWSLKPPW